MAAAARGPQDTIDLQVTRTTVHLNTRTRTTVTTATTPIGIDLTGDPVAVRRIRTALATDENLARTPLAAIVHRRAHDPGDRRGLVRLSISLARHPLVRTGRSLLGAHAVGLRPLTELNLLPRPARYQLLLPHLHHSSTKRSVRQILGSNTAQISNLKSLAKEKKSFIGMMVKVLRNHQGILDQNSILSDKSWPRK